MHGLKVRAHILNLHLLDKVEIEEPGIAVPEHIIDYIEGVALQSIAAVEPPSHHQTFRFLSYDGSVLRRSKYRLWCVLRHVNGSIALP